MIAGYPIFDVHVHTHHSSCACQEPGYSVAWILDEARRLGHDGLVFADHVGDNRGSEDAKGIRRPEALARELAALDLAGAIPHAIGLEAEEGWVPPAAAGRYIVLVSCNDGHEPADADRLRGCRPRAFAEYLLARTRRALAGPLISVLPHPLLGRGRADGVEIFQSYRDEEILDVLNLARERGVIIELHRQLVEDSAHLIGREDALRFCRLCGRSGVRLAFGTDSHWPWHLASTHPLVALARYAGLGPEQFIAALPRPAG